MESVAKFKTQYGCAIFNFKNISVVDVDGDTPDTIKARVYTTTNDAITVPPPLAAEFLAAYEKWAGLK